MRKEILIGFIVAIIATIFGFYLYVNLFSKYDFYETMEIIREGDLLGKVLALAAIPNLFVFFIFLKKKQDYRARGVLMATIVIAIVMLVLKFL
jgi:H+/gluconate symporter-like permease